MALKIGNQLSRIICHAFYILLIKESCCKKTNCYIICAQPSTVENICHIKLFFSIYAGLNISLTVVLFPLQSLSVCGQSHKVFDICTQFAWDIFLFQVKKDGNGFFFPQEWTSQSNSIFMVFVADWIIFHSLCSQPALGIESLPLKHDSLLRLFSSPHSIPRTWQPCPIQTCALLPFIVGHKWMVSLSTLEAGVTH